MVSDLRLLTLVNYHFQVVHGMYEQAIVLLFSMSSVSHIMHTCMYIPMALWYIHVYTHVSVAAQMWTFSTLLPLMIADKVTVDHPAWAYFCFAFPNYARQELLLKMWLHISLL